MIPAPNDKRAVAARVRAHEAGHAPAGRALDCPGIEEAVRGMAFIECAVAASDSEIKWHTLAQH